MLIILRTELHLLPGEDMAGTRRKTPPPKPTELLKCFHCGAKFEGEKFLVNHVASNNDCYFNCTVSKIVQLAGARRKEYKLPT